MESLAFLVQKFFPPKCPSCEHPFSSHSDFGIYVGQDGSFMEAKIRQTKLFAELFDLQEGEPGVFASTNKFGADFIICTHCKNVTFRIEYGSRQVMTREEAVRLVTTKGFTCWQEVQAFGNMARPYSSLSLLGSADYGRLAEVVKDAKQRASKEDLDNRPDTFERTIDPALVEYVNKVRENQITISANQRVHQIFQTLWNQLVPESRDFLVTAEILKDELTSLTETDPSIDFSAPVTMYSKALEKDLVEKLFRPFAISTRAKIFPTDIKNKDLAKSVTTLQGYIAGSRELSLGDMAFCLLNVGCKMRTVPNNGFVEFLQTCIRDLEFFCNRQKFPVRLIQYVQKYRNKSAHVAKLSKDDCMAARAFLLEEPVRLLILFQEMLKKRSE